MQPSELRDLLDAIEKIFGYYAPQGSTLAVRLVLSSASAVLALVSVVRSFQQGNAIRDIAMEQLRQHILARINTPDLLTPAAVKALAVSIQESLHAPALTNANVAQVIRLVALDLEAKYKGEKLLQRLRTLDRALRGVDSNAKPLLSIASVDSTLAFLIANLSLLVRVYLLALFVLVFLPQGWLSNGILACVVAAFLVIVFANLRAGRYWAGRPPAEAKADAAEAQPKVHKLLDYFLYRTISNDWNLVNVEWAPVWETWLMLAVVWFPLPATVVVLRLCVLFHMSFANALFTSLLFGIAFVTFAKFVMHDGFILMHVYNFFPTRRLRNRLQQLEGAVAEATIIHQPVGRKLLEKLALVNEQLWLINGDESYKERMEWARVMLVTQASAAPGR